MTSETKDQLEMAFLRLQKEQFKAFAQLAVEVLTAQRLYFKTRSNEALIAAKQLEKRLSDRATEILKAD